MGVATDANLPERWSEGSANIHWKTNLPGEGCSSPIVNGNRVFVTTAYEDPMPQIVRRVAVGAGSFLTVLFVLMILAGPVSRLRARPLAADGIRSVSAGQALSTALAGMGVGAFFLASVVLLFLPERYDATVGGFLARLLGTYDTEHLFYIGKEVGAATWLNTGAVALFGYATALHWIRARSVWRLIGSLVFVPLAAAFVVLTPPDEWKYRVVLWTRLLFIVPAALVATWHLLGYFEIRLGTESGEKTPLLQSLNNVHISWKHKDMHRSGGARSLVLFALITALAALVFIPVNLLLPQRNMCRAVVCLDLETGQILWETRVFTAAAERKHRDNSYATPTPATDGRHVVANFGVGVACLDVDGRMIWKVADPHYADDTRYGAAASVLICNDKTIILQESEENTKRSTWMAAFETASGEVQWKVYPPHLRMAYTTGLLHDDGTGTKLIIASFRSLLCFDTESGSQLWEHDIPMEQIVASLTRSGSTFYVGGGTWGPKGLIAFRLPGPQAHCPVEELWRASEDTPGCVSPVICNGILFTITDAGVMRAYDAACGKLYWRKRLKGRYLASPVAGDGKVYACNTNGLTTVVAAEPQLRILARNELDSGCYASFAVADSHLIVRTEDSLYCIAPCK